MGFINLWIKGKRLRQLLKATTAHNCGVSEPSGPEIVFIIFSFSCEENWQILATHFHILWHNLPLKLNEVYGVTLHREMCLLCITMFLFYGAHLNFIFVFVEIASDFTHFCITGREECVHLYENLSLSTAHKFSIFGKYISLDLTASNSAVAVSWVWKRVYLKSFKVCKKVLQSLAHWYIITLWETVSATLFKLNSIQTSNMTAWIFCF